MSMHPKDDPKRRLNKQESKAQSSWLFVAFIVGMILGTLITEKAMAAVDCSLDGTAGLTEAYGQTVVDSGSIGAGETLASMGESNTRQIFAQVQRSDINLVNSATGGCTIGNYARDNPSKCWDAMPKSAAVVWIKPINRSQGVDPGAYVATLEQDIVTALTQISTRITGVKEVWLSGHHATPYAGPRPNGLPPKQEEPYSHDSILAIQSVVANYQGSYPFRLVNAAYLWAPASKPRADGLQWTCDLFSDDGVHLSSTGNQRAAGLLSDYISNALGAEPPPPPPSEFCPTPAWAERKGYTCSFDEGQQRCVCRP